MRDNQQRKEEKTAPFFQLGPAGKKVRKVLLQTPMQGMWLTSFHPAYKKESHYKGVPQNQQQLWVHFLERSHLLRGGRPCFPQAVMHTRTISCFFALFALLASCSVVAKLMLGTTRRGVRRRWWAFAYCDVCVCVRVCFFQSILNVKAVSFSSRSCAKGGTSIFLQLAEASLLGSFDRITQFNSRCMLKSMQLMAPFGLWQFLAASRCRKQGW